LAAAAAVVVVVVAAFVELVGPIGNLPFVAGVKVARGATKDREPSQIDVTFRRARRRANE
jgi:hypothetical protein